MSQIQSASRSLIEFCTNTTNSVSETQQRMLVSAAESQRTLLDLLSRVQLLHFYRLFLC